MTIINQQTDNPSDAIFAMLLADAKSSRRMLTLTRLKAACDHLSQKGHPILLSSIQKFIESNFGKDVGPKAQSISNEKRREIGMYHYVEARERERRESCIGGRKFGASRPDSNPIDDIESIEDIDLRSRMRNLFDRLIVAEKALARAKIVLKTLYPGADVDRLVTGKPPNEPPMSLTIPATQVASLRKLVGVLFDNETLATVGLCHDAGRVRRKAGTKDELFDPKTLEDLQMLLQQLTSVRQIA
ncbi:hypothetical protein [Burkholderia ubonensis]|uniref:hypothetical protein n=1 Tax=Burkholderia ubonensis TaxID=101571 RepID=UPI000ABBE331|nr:hypothetical protein [Burkholderia ubonensis]